MNKRGKIKIGILLSLVMCSFSGCGYEVVLEPESSAPSSTETEGEDLPSDSTQNDGSDSEVIEIASTLDGDTLFTNNEWTLSYEEESATSITLDDESITITEEGTYILSGDIQDGQIVVSVEETEKVHLVLDGVDITNSTSAAIYIIEADKVFITLADGSYNTLTVSGAYVNTDETNIDSVIYAKSDLSFLGEGTLEINGDYGHGIVGKDDLVFMSGTYIINAENHGITGNDSIRIADGEFTITSGKDGMQAENEEDSSKGYVYVADGDFYIEAQQYGITSSSLIQIDGGEFEILSGGGYVEVLNEITVGEGSGNTKQATDYLEYNMKGMKAYNMEFNGGTFYISSYEDAFHANYNLIINDGDFYILSGDDGVHADNKLVINGGNIVVEEGYEGIESCYIFINGGNVEVNVYDDAINASQSYGYIYISGGTIYLSCVGDGLDSNGSFTMEGGEIIIDCNPIYSGGDGNVDVTGSVTYTGGTIVDGDGNTIDPEAGLSSSGGSSFSQSSPFSNSNSKPR